MRSSTIDTHIHLCLHTIDRSSICPMTDLSEINFPESTGTRRALSKLFYVEILRNVSISSCQSLIIFTALDARNESLLVPEACAMLSSSGYKCVENCDILRLAELPCSKVGLNSVGLAVVVVLASIAIFYCRNNNRARVSGNNHLREVIRCCCPENV